MVCLTALTYKQKIILVALFVTLFLVSSIYWYQSSLLNQPLIEQPTTLDNSVEQLEHQSNDNVQLDIEEQTLIYVHVKGAVNSPGVYQLTSKSRVLHAVEAAG